MSKLKNIEAVNKILRGEHRLQNRTTVGWREKKEFVPRNVGDTWEEVLPNGQIVLWEQMKGYRRRIHKNQVALAELRQELKEFSRCYDTCEKKKTKRYTKYDYNTRITSGMCLDCLAKFETELKAKGEFEEYERMKKLASALAFLKDAEREKELIKQSFDKIGYVEENGKVEGWSMENKEALIKKIDDDFEKLKHSLLDPLLLENENSTV